MPQNVNIINSDMDGSINYPVPVSPTTPDMVKYTLLQIKENAKYNFLHLFSFKMLIVFVSSYVILCIITTPFSTKFVFMPKYIF